MTLAELLNNLTTPKPLEEIKDRQDMDVIPERGAVTQVDAVTSRFTLTQGFPDPVQTAVVALVPPYRALAAILYI